METPLTKSAAGPEVSWQERRDWLHTRLRAAPPEDIGVEELEAHFAGMPAHYWRQVAEADLVWVVRMVHSFLKLVAESNEPVTRPVVEWRQLAQAGQTRLLLCTWDRHGLLAKAAAALSAVRLNIVQAEAFTRADDIVLDVFTVEQGVEKPGEGETPRRGPAREEQLREMLFLLDGALSEPPRFTSLWMCLRHECLVPTGQPAPRIAFDNESSETDTIVHIEAADRLGLLYDLLQTLADEGLNITHADIRTRDKRARDSIYVRDAHGQKVLASERLELLSRKLHGALTLTQSLA